MPDTWADIEDLERDVGYTPATPVEVGIRRFVDWYCEYYKDGGPVTPKVVNPGLRRESRSDRVPGSTAIASWDVRGGTVPGREIIVDRRIRIALVGCGRIAANHFSAIDKHADRIELTAVCDNDPRALDNAVGKTGAKGFVDLADLLAENVADVVALCTGLSGILRSVLILFNILVRTLFVSLSINLLLKVIKPDLKFWKRILRLNHVGT